MPQESQPTSAELTPLERFTWTVLGDLVFEDSYALWEAILSTDPAFRELPAADARSVSAQAIRDLLDRGWIYLFRLDGLNPNEAYTRSDLRLTSAEAHDHVSRMLQTEEVMSHLWMAPTELGTAAANDPPPAVKRLWGWDAETSDRRRVNRLDMES